MFQVILTLPLVGEQIFEKNAAWWRIINFPLPGGMMIKTLGRVLN